MSSIESATAPTKPVRIDTVEELDVLVVEYDRVLLDIYTKGCMLCQSIESVLGDVSKATDVVVAMLSPQTDMSVAERYMIRGVPTLLLLENDELVDHLVDGFQRAQAVADFVEKER